MSLGKAQLLFQDLYLLVLLDDQMMQFLNIRGNSAGFIVIATATCVALSNA